MQSKNLIIFSGVGRMCSIEDEVELPLTYRSGGKKGGKYAGKCIGELITNEKYKKDLDLDAQDANGMTPLHYAASHNDQE